MEQKININNIKYTFTSEEDVRIQMNAEEDEGGLSFYRIRFAWEETACPKPVRMAYTIPCRDMYMLWDPLLKARHIAPHWSNSSKSMTVSRLAEGMPLKGLVSKDGKCTYLLALSDVKSPIRITMGASERDASIHVLVEFFSSLTGPFACYEVLLRADHRSLPLDEAVFEARAWFNALGYKPAYSPELTKCPMYSTWYSLWQTVTAKEVLRECRQAVKYGMKTVIIDDGWQTDRAGMIYGYCGDWKPSYRKFRNMKGLVDQLHGLGLKVMLWFSVPYVGFYSKRHRELEGMYLSDFNHANCSILDPRYPKVRDFIVSTYAQAVKDFGLDGLKLDFIDRFCSNGQVSEGMDFVSVEDATEQLLRQISTTLRRINPEIMIEFRQPYFGPVIGAYGNMIRVWDCPLDGVTNKNQTLNLRLVSDTCAVHSDMIYWHPEDTPEGVATQLLGTLFSVPQISARFWEITKEQKNVLRAYLDFWNQHRHTLMDGKLSVKTAENGYGYASASLDGEKIALAVTHAVLDMDTHTQEGYLFNLTQESTVILRAEGGGRLYYETFDCTGRRLSRKRAVRGRLSEIPLPLCAMLKVTRATE